jgi:hypothetical protein
MIEAAGAELRYLPPYSPDFNPIENAFAKLKALLRKAAERTISSLWDAIPDFSRVMVHRGLDSGKTCCARTGYNPWEVAPRCPHTVTQTRWISEGREAAVWSLPSTADL